MWLSCPYLQGDVELTDERTTHITRTHGELLPDYLHRLEEAVADPDQVLVDPEYEHTRLFVRWYNDLMGGKNVVVAIVSTPSPPRNWVVTAFLTSRNVKGTVEWRRS